MFRRLFAEEGYLLIPVISLVLVVLAWSAFAIRAWRTPRNRIDAAASLPLRDDDSSSPARPS